MKHLYLFACLLLLSFLSPAFAQQSTTLSTHHSGNKLSAQPGNQAVRTLGFSGSLQQQSRGLNGVRVQNGNSTSFQRQTVTCAQDTVLYPLSKASGLRSIDLNTLLSATSLGQWYETPQPITVSGMDLYAYVSDSTNATVTLTCAIYNASPIDSMPIGAPLRTVTLTVDSNGRGNPTLAATLKSVTFPTPVTVTQPYVLTVTTSSSTVNAGILTNDFVFGNGGMEWLGMAQLGTNWLPGDSIFVGAFTFDADVLLHPHASYDLTPDFADSTGCTGDTLLFRNLSSPINFSRFYNRAATANVPQLSFTWDYDDGSPTENVVNGRHAYTTGGVYNVNLLDTLFGWVTTCVSDTTIPITVQVTPTAGFTQSVTGLQVAFTDTSIGPGTSWLWNFGDGNTSTQRNPTHNYFANGTYNVCLTVTNACGTDSVCKNISVTCVPPTSNFTFTSSFLTVTFNDISSGPPTSWAWNFGDGNSSTLQNPTHTYANPGTYTVCLTTSNQCGSPSTVCQSVLVTCPVPSAGFTKGRLGLNASFTDITTGTPTSWFWTFGDGNTDTVQNPNHSYAAAGTYTVCLISTNPCGVDTICDTINVTQCIVPVAAFGDTATLLSVNFTDSSTINPTSWLWSFGDGNTSTQQNPNHSYANPGTYTVCLIATNVCGSDTICSQVTVVCPTPGVLFGDSISGTVVFFTDSSSGSPTSWVWDFGDGNSSIQQNPNHFYTNPGQYTVCLIATNSCGSDTICRTLAVGCTPPAAAFNSTSLGQTVNFNNLSTAGTGATYSWDFGDGNSSTMMSPSHTYSTTGTFTICLIVTDGCGTDSTCTVINIACPNTAANFTSTSSGLSVNFSDLSTNTPTSWLWSFGDGNTSTQSSPNHTYTTAGTYTVCLVATNACGSDSTCQVLNVTCVNPSAAFTNAINGTQVNFINSSTGNPSQFLWNFGDGNTSFVQNPTHIYSTPGTYTVCLVVVNSCGVDTTCTNVTITCQAPAAQFSSNSTGLTVAFSDNSTGTTSQWTWDFGDGNTSSLQSPVHSYTNGGTYIVCLIVNSICGNDTSCQTITVSCPAPNSNFVYSSQNQTAKFTDISTGSPTQWSWNFGDGNTSTLQNPSHTYASGGVYTACLTVTSICGTDTICQQVLACAPPVADFDFSGNITGIQFSDSSTGSFNTWSWDFGDGNTSSQQNPMHTYAAIGSYQVCLEISGSCGVKQICKLVGVGVGVDDPLFSRIDIYPNPTSGNFFIDAELNDASEMNISLVNVLGVRVLEKTVEVRNTFFKEEIEMSGLADGTYFLLIETDQGSLYRRIVKGQ